MADYAELKELADHKLGDRWIGVSAIGPVTVNSVTPSNSLTRVRMTFRKGSETFILDSRGSKGISIDNAITWEASIAARDDFLPSAGKWKWDLEFYQSGYDSPWTLYRGTLMVRKDV